MNDFTKELEMAKERLLNDMRYSLEQFTKFTSNYCGWEKQNELKKECLFTYYRFYGFDNDE